MTLVLLDICIDYYSIVCPTTAAGDIHKRSNDFHDNLLFFSTMIFTFGRDMPIFQFKESDIGDYSKTLLGLNLFSLGVILSFCLPLYLFGKSFSFGFVNSPVSRFPQESVRKRLNSRTFQTFLIIVCALPALVILIMSDFSDLLSRDTFPLQSIDNLSMGVADTFFWIAAVCTPALKNRKVRILVLFLTIAVFSAAGQRQAVVCIFIFIIVERLAFNRSGFGHIILATFSIWLLGTLIGIRYLWEGGLFNVLKLMFSRDFLAIQYAVFAFNYMTNYSIINTTNSIISVRANLDDFIYAINPLPSRFLEVQKDLSQGLTFKQMYHIQDSPWLW